MEPQQRARPSSSVVVSPVENEDTDYVTDLARALYVHFCKIRGYTVQPPPFVPVWCLDYSRIAVRFMDEYGPHVPLREDETS